MENTDEGKKLGTILFIVIILIMTIILIIFASSSMNIKKRNKGYTPTTTTMTTTTRAPDYDFEEIPDVEKITYNEWLNQEAIILALENATNGVFSTNMLESETSKFRFIYTYANYKTPDEVMSIEKINEYAMLLFNMELDENNLFEYKVTNGFKYHITNTEIPHCYKVNLRMNQTLLVNKVHFNEESCNLGNNYNEDDIISTLRIGYDLINGNYVFNTYIIIR